MKSNSVFKRAYNRTLSLLEGCELAADIGSEPSWADRLGVSRTTVRAILQMLVADGLIAFDGRRKTLKRRPTSRDRYPDGETRPVRDIVEKQFMRWILDGDCKPGQQINGLELARQFGVSTSAIRDYLNGFSQFGLLERRPNGSWMFRGVTPEFAEELFEVRVMFELRAAQRFVAMADDDPVWIALEQIRREHLLLREQAESRFTDFSELDERLHRLINDASRNRFIVGFYDVISMIFHYHYQWNKRDEKQRNIAAIGEHLAYIEALQSRDRNAATATCRAHMATARSTLLDSIRQFENRTG
ncbi:MAG TPA: GntR family transcriptional regulator [Bradyrhizobium sp.]|jgi:DNA-binding GntR family transcriptional regulator